MKSARLGFKQVVIALLIAVTGSMYSQQTPAQASPIAVGTVALLADPQKYDGKRIRTIGFACVEFESNVLYLHKEDFQYANNKNALWLRLSDTQRKEYGKLSLKYVIIEGTFYATGPERFEFGGAIGDITRLEYSHPLFDAPATPKIPSGKQRP